MNRDALALFYGEPEFDRWLAYDRIPRRVVRRVIRGKPRPGGQKRVFLNLCAGLDRIGVKYRANDYKHARRHPDDIACIVGKPHVLDRMQWRNPILFGAAVYSHPTQRARLLEELPNIRRILVPCEWMRRMCAPYYGDRVVAWPVGIDTERWKPTDTEKQFEFLMYDKIRWHHAHFEATLIEPIRETLRARSLTFREIRYGYYREEEYEAALQKCRAMIFLCEHETQGIAYQQALSAGVPILAWDRGGYWQDPEFYPEKVKFGPVASVPYWDDRCGVRFASAAEFSDKLEEFVSRFHSAQFAPRDYILENLTLEKCAADYVEHYRSVAASG